MKTTDKEFSAFVDWVAQSDANVEERLLLHLVGAFSCCPELIEKTSKRIKNKEYEKLLDGIRKVGLW